MINLKGSTIPNSNNVDVKKRRNAQQNCIHWKY